MLMMLGIISKKLHKYRVVITTPADGPGIDTSAETMIAKYLNKDMNYTEICLIPYLCSSSVKRHALQVKESP